MSPRTSADPALGWLTSRVTIVGAAKNETLSWAPSTSKTCSGSKPGTVRFCAPAITKGSA